jgi:hypothetical protein
MAVNLKNIYQNVSFGEFDQGNEKFGMYLPDRNVILWNDVPKDRRVYTFHYDFERAGVTEFGEIWTESDSILDVLNKHGQLKEEWLEQYQKLFRRVSAYFTAYSTLPLSEIVKEAIPEDLLKSWFLLKSQITQDIFNSVTPRPQEARDHLAEIRWLIERVSRTPLNLDRQRVFTFSRVDKSNMVENVRKNSINTIRYDMWKGATGRLTTKDGSFPILNLRRDYRSMVRPHNSFFMEMDFNAADVRSFLYLFDDRNKLLYENIEDIYDVFREKLDLERIERKELKSKTMAKLYDYSYNELLRSFDVNKKIHEVVEFVDDENGVVTFRNPTGRRFSYQKGEKYLPHHLVSYLAQGTTNDMLLSVVAKIETMLMGYKSRVAWMIHDSVVLDMDEEEYNILSEKLRHVFSQTPIGRYHHSLYVGYNFGKMEKM